MLERLLREPGGNFVVFSEESNGGRETLAGPAACNTPDIAARLWLVDLVNSQVMEHNNLKGVVSFLDAKLWLVEE